ncbi:MAG: ABC transporter ATP-binding protein [Rhodospirillaceae bacterium]|jgi:tungstate transport system ATP-binding protein|nr:ABC transporter ATP-binding protein [Rhodospirillaceae bacterium]
MSDIQGIRSGSEIRKKSMLTLETRDLVLELNKIRYINKINMAIRSDNLTVIMGENGAGKSLLLRLLHGLINPTHGEVLWNGVQINHSIRKQQAMVFQRPVLLRRTVAANIDFVLRLKGLNHKDHRDQILENVGLLEFYNKPARTLSVGEQQRLALARSLATNPEIIFLDEPTASLDPSSTHAIEKIVARAHKNGTKIIFITHNLGQARRVADDIVFLHKGRLVEHSPAITFFDNPTSEAAKAYLEGRILL